VDPDERSDIGDKTKLTATGAKAELK